jgi:hypothetical protein
MHSSPLHARICPVTEAIDFQGVLSRPDGPATQTHVSLPFDVKAVFGRSRCPVRVTINDHTWRTTTRVSGGSYHVVVSESARESAGIKAGDTVRVEVVRDDAVRAVDLPAELVAALRGDSAARDAYEALAASHRREYARWVGDAKRSETRSRRAVAAVERLKSGTHRPATA